MVAKNGGVGRKKRTYRRIDLTYRGVARKKSLDEGWRKKVVFQIEHFYYSPLLTGVVGTMYDKMYAYFAFFETKKKN